MSPSDELYLYHNILFFGQLMIKNKNAVVRNVNSFKSTMHTCWRFQCPKKGLDLSTVTTRLTDAGGNKLMYSIDMYNSNLYIPDLLTHIMNPLEINPILIYSFQL